MPVFKKAYKKLYANEKSIVDDAICNIIKNPKMGEEKKGDLGGIFVYKFKLKTKEFLLGYEWNIKQRLLLALSVHENFYRDLKKKIR
ncbi:MAG: type toxin-antitoxin system RelE/ParE family toxin [Gammaproteobacteria bacterium]|nr:type toxin-antitoxin system RelE/ParE family toxin [Gammaproteobacteria bacterium]